MHTYIHTYIHTYTHTYTHIHTQHTHTQTHKYSHTHKHTHTHTHTHVTLISNFLFGAYAACSSFSLLVAVSTCPQARVHRAPTSPETTPKVCVCVSSWRVGATVAMRCCTCVQCDHALAAAVSHVLTSLSLILALTLQLFPLSVQRILTGSILQKHPRSKDRRTTPVPHGSLFAMMDALVNIAASFTGDCAFNVLMVCLSDADVSKSLKENVGLDANDAIVRSRVA